MLKRTTLLGVLLALFFMVLVLWKIDFEKLYEALAAADYWYVLPAAVITLTGYFLRTERWRSILRPSRVLSIGDLFPIVMIGFMANNVLPARAGEVARAYVLHRRTAIGKTVALSTILLERLLDGLTLVLFIGVLSIRFPLPDWGTGLAQLAGGIFAVGVVVVSLLLLRGDGAGRLLRLVCHLLPKRLGDRIVVMFDAALLGLAALRRRQSILKVALLSVLIWTAEAASYYIIMRGFNLGLPQGGGVFAAVFLLVVVNLAIMLPSAPGYVGTFHASGVLALSAFTVQREPALGVAVVSHAMQYLLVTGLGLLFLWRGRLSLIEIGAAEVAT